MLFFACFKEEIFDFRKELDGFAVRLVIAVFKLVALDAHFIESFNELIDFGCLGGVVCLEHILFEHGEKGVEVLLRLSAACLIFKEHSLGDLFSYFNDGVKGGKRILENHRDFIAADLAHLVLGNSQKVFAVIEDFAALDDGVSGEDSEDCLTRYGFTGAGFADDCEGFSAFKVKGDVADSLQRAVRGTEGYLKVFYFKNFIHSLILHTTKRRVERIAQTVAEKVETNHQK